jgi:hypothetical protein
MAGLAINPVQVFGPSSFIQCCIAIGSEATLLSELCVIRCPSYLVWSKTFLLGVGLTELGHFGRYFGQNKEIVSGFNGPVVCFNVGSIGLTSLGMGFGARQEIYFQLLFEKYFGR